ncbi:hypothetical protein D049_3958, partial [Vibrio parahaemolyticus VPTS-2010]
FMRAAKDIHWQGPPLLT